ncbi:MAG: 30S ribosomal protein S12 methylthiotransferase RimO [Myxococcota bacterium]
MKKQPTVHLVSLGCPKNRVDSEVMLGHVVNDGYQVVDRAKDAEVIIINTCGFIDAAKEEAVDVILDMAHFKTAGTCKKLIVAGCLSQRYAPELAREIPEVDHFLGTGNFETIGSVLGGRPATTLRSRRLPVVTDLTASNEGTKREHGQHRPRRVSRNALVPYRHDPLPSSRRVVRIPDPDFTITASSPRVRTMPPHTAYVKVSEGCSNTCSFCVIPKLRGPQRSRTVQDVVTEVERLVQQGAVEINLIAQDLCGFGKDLDPAQSLAQLLRALNRVGCEHDGPVWIRCLYAYPKGLTREVMEVLAGSDSILPYLDIPLQHISDQILRRMRRGKGGPATRDLLHRLRAAIPGLVLRTTFITGFPGETEAELDELCELVEEIRFERMGVFVFSPEEDTEAALMPDQIDANVAAGRRDRLMALQRDISREQQKALVGKTLDVLVEGVAEETDLLLKGRHRGQAPDIDGVTYINSGTASPGQVVRILIDQAHDYDLVGGIVEPQPRLKHALFSQPRVIDSGV